MIPDIKNSANPIAQGQASPRSSGNIGTISQLQSEIKLIQNLSLIRIHGSDNLSFEGKPVQLLHASSPEQHSFTLINTGPKISIDAQNAKVSLSPPNQASLNFPKATANGAPLNINNLTLASRIITLTALSQSTALKGVNLTNVSDGQNTLQITSQIPLQKGESVRVLLDANNNLQVIPNKTTQVTSPPIEALKQSLPKQLSNSEMSQLIKQLQTINNAQNSSLTVQSQRALAQLIQGLPSLDQLTQSPEVMKNAIHTSGTFSESLLKNASPSLNADLKINLTKLDNLSNEQSTQRPANFPTEQIANAIERVTTNQLRHLAELSQTNTQIYPLHIELPIKDNQSSSLVQLKIDKDSQDNTTPEHDRRWLVKLNFDFEETGRFEARVSIQGNTVGIMFAAEKTETTVAIKQQINNLKQQLKNKDIKVQRLEAFHTTLKESKTDTPNRASLIDVRT